MNPGKLIIRSLLSIGVSSLLYLTTAQTAHDIVTATGLKAGLCARIGTTDGNMEADLAAGGTILVHGLALDHGSVDAARAAIRARNLYGVASVEMAPPLTSLPYAENMVNVLVADLDNLSSRGLTESEVMRVVAPEGFAYIKSGGTWAAKKKPRPAQMGEWRSYWGADGNLVSTDELVKPATSLKWLAWYDVSAGEGLHGPNNWQGRAAGGRFVARNRYYAGGEKAFISCRDAFNGVQLWLKSSWGTRHEPFVLTEKYLYTVEKSGDTLRALDVQDGRTAQVFTKGGALQGSNPASLQVIVADGMIIECNRTRVVVLDSATGEKKSEYVEPTGKYLYMPVYDKARKRACMIAATRDLDLWRWSHMKQAAAIVSVDLVTGTEAWRCSEFIGKGGGAIDTPDVGQLMIGGDHLIAFTPNGIGGGTPYLGGIRLTDGRLLWQHEYQRGMVYVNCGKWKPNYWQKVCPENDPRPRGIVSANHAVIATGRLHLIAQAAREEYDIATGAFLRTFAPHVPNQRCTRSVATPKYHLMGFQVYADWSDNQWTYQQIARSTCATNPIPANGMVYYGPNTQCGCFTRLRHQVCLSSEPILPLLSDEARIERGTAGLPKAVVAAGWVNQATPLRKTSATAAGRVPVTAGSPIRADWNNNDALAYPETTLVVANDVKYVSVVNEHRLEARGADNAVRWSFTADSRITGAPVISNGLCFFGSYDGYVYAVRNDNGKLVWRFLAGRNHRKIVRHSQLASAWPIFGAVLYAGKICVSAGHHPELDGGILIWGLEPATGAVAWRGAIRRDVKWLQPTDRSVSGFVNRILNGLPKGTDSLVMAGIKIDPANPPGKEYVRVIPIDGRASSKMPANTIPRISVCRDGLQLDWGPDARGELSFEILTTQGRSVVEGSVNSGHKFLLPTNQLSTGTYVVKMRTGGRWNVASVKILQSGQKYK